MKNLLIAILLAIFTLQATVVAVGAHGQATAQVERLVAASGNDTLDHTLIADDDGRDVSAAIEELSDYLPAELFIPPGTFIAPFVPLAEPVLLTISLPNSTPPPRA